MVLDQSAVADSSTLAEPINLLGKFALLVHVTVTVDGKLKLWRVQFLVIFTAFGK